MRVTMTILLFCESTAPKLKQIPKKSRAVGIETEAFSYLWHFVAHAIARSEIPRSAGKQSLLLIREIASLRSQCQVLETLYPTRLSRFTKPEVLPTSASQRPRKLKKPQWLNAILEQTFSLEIGG
jgi:hypothetical protein